MVQLPSPTTIGEAVKYLSKMFQAAGIDQARLDARVIVTHIAGCAPESALVHPQRDLSHDHAAAIEKLADRRLQREPVAYLTGTREFWSLPISVDRHTLTPRPDTETLVESVIAEVGSERRDDALTILDLGTGSGCVLASLLSEFPNSAGLGIDINPPTIDVARRNAEALGLSDRMRVVQGNWLDDVTQAFDVVVSNPPYIQTKEIDDLEPEVSLYEPRIALDGGVDGLDAYRRIVTRLKSVLKPGGIAAFELGVGQAEDIRKVFRNNGFANFRFFSDLAGIQRVLLVTNDD